MNVQMLILAGIFAALAMVPWIHIGKGGRDDGWFPRTTAWMLGRVGGGADPGAARMAGRSRGVHRRPLASGSSPWWSLFGGLCFYLQAVHRRKDKKPKADKNGVQRSAVREAAP